MAEQKPGVYLSLGTTLEEDIATQVIVKSVTEDGSALRWPMSATETRQFAAALLDYADAIDKANDE